MRAFVVVATLVAAATAAPGNYLANAPAAHIGYAAAGPAVAHTVPAGPAVAHVAESYHAGPAVAQTHVEHGVVGSRTIQVGQQAVQVGHQYQVVGQEVHQPQPYSFVAGEAINTAETRALPAPALPYAAAPAAVAIPPAPVNLGPAPIDTVTQEKVLAPARTHTIVTPRRTEIVPQLQVNQVPYDVPVAVPVPVEREVLVERRVQRPYNVPVPRAVAVPKPYKVHPVHEVVETPVVREHVHTTAVHQPVAHVAQYAAAPVAHAGYAAAPVAHAGYAAVAPVAAAAVAPAAAVAAY